MFLKADIMHCDRRALTSRSFLSLNLQEFLWNMLQKCWVVRGRGRGGGREGRANMLCSFTVLLPSWGVMARSPLGRVR